MKKTIKLTESELVNLVKKIVNEQQSVQIAKPINIKVVVSGKKGDETYLVGFTSFKKTKDGCTFFGKFRGDEKQHTFDYKCDGTLIWTSSGLLSSSTPVTISSDAGKLLQDACGCDVYASNKPTQSSTQSQMAEAAPEAINTGEMISYFTFGFPEGKATPNIVGSPLSKMKSVDEVINIMTQEISNSKILNVLEKFGPSGSVPEFIHIHVGTSHSGTGEANASVAEARLNFLENLVTKAMSKLGVDSQIIKSLIVRDSETIYQPSKLNKNFYDPKKLQPKAYERFGEIGIYELREMGLNTAGIQGVQKGLNSASSVINTWVVDNVDEDLVVKNITKLQSFSDIIDLSNSINAGGKWRSLEDFLNDQLFDDNEQMKTIKAHLSKLAVRSGKQADTIRLFMGNNGLRISIGIGQ